jgi:hypothetical protein
MLPAPPVRLFLLVLVDPAGLGRASRVLVGAAAAGGVGGRAASQASTAAIASACSCARRRPASPPSSCTSMVNPGGPDRGRRPRLQPWPTAAAAGSRAGGVDGGSGGACTPPCSPVDGDQHRWPRSTAEVHGWGVSHPTRVVSRSRRSGRPHGPVRPRRAQPVPTTIHCQGCTATVHLRRHRGPRRPQHGSRPDDLARVTQPSRAAPARRNRPAPRHGGRAAVRSPVGH